MADVVPAPEPDDVDRRLDGGVGSFAWHGYDIGYEVRGTGDKAIVLIHGLLLPSWVNGEIARRLADRGARVVLLDLLGHGRSDKPLHASEHRLEYAGQQVVALLDHLGIDEAVVGGMSLGANVALEVAARHPHRVRGLICEMPVLERGAVSVMLTLFPLLAVLRFGGPPMRAILRLGASVPRTGHEALNAIFDTASEARAMAAIMHGYSAGPVCPPARERFAIAAPTLILGHGRDWMHPLNDAEALAGELSNATMVHAHSIFELRARPDRLMAEITAFVDAVYS